MEELYRLPERYVDVVDDEEFLRGQRSYSEDEFELEESGITAELEELREVLEDVMDDPELEAGSAEIDARVAPTLHQTLDISRRQAAEEEIWYYLTVLWAPDFVRYRWPRDAPNRTRKSMKEKFLGSHRDIYSNAFHRLWWIAEITHQPGESDPYENTKRVLSKQALANKIFDRDFGRSPVVANVCIELLHDESDTVIEEATTRLNHALSTIPLEGLSKSEAEHIVNRIKSDVAGTTS